MIQPKRYSLVASYYCSDAKMEAFEDGEFVRHADYAALQAENARLRKAGDAMENELFRVILMELPGLEKEDINNQYISEWLAAKGVQP
ncbi:MAG: hypothetical protein ACK5VI_09920 [Opitutia bacterium]